MRSQKSSFDPETGYPGPAQLLGVEEFSDLVVKFKYTLFFHDIGDFKANLEYYCNEALYEHREELARKRKYVKKKK